MSNAVTRRPAGRRPAKDSAPRRRPAKTPRFLNRILPFRALNPAAGPNCCVSRRGTVIAGGNMAEKSKEKAMETALARRLEIEDVPLTNDEQRKLAFDMFNLYWEDATNQGIEFDVIGTMSISAALFALVAKHGNDTTAEFVDDLAKSVRNDEFRFRNHTTN
jgi:hypothetical protein